MRATIICPTYDHGALIKHAITSVLHQSHQDFEIFIIGDGVPDAVRGAVEEIARIDPRITFIERPKSKRHGEEYRHEVLTKFATGEVALYISDDDLWFPDHLESLITLLKDNDIAHCVPCNMSATGRFWFSVINWGNPIWRSWTLDPPRNNAVSLSMAGHRMDFYHRLPHGWRTTPKEEFSDHYMWKQMLSMPHVRAAGLEECTVIKLDSPSRNSEKFSQDDRFDELASWATNLQHNPNVVRQYLILQKAIWDRSQLALDHRLNPIIEELVECLKKNKEQGANDRERLRLELDKKRQRIIKLKAQLAARDNPPKGKVNTKWYKRIFR